MMQFLTDHWVEIGAIVYAAVSEIIGISPAKSNSVVQLVLGVLGKFFKK